MTYCKCCHGYTDSYADMHGDVCIICYRDKEEMN